MKRSERNKSGRIYGHIRKVTPVPCRREGPWDVPNAYSREDSAAVISDGRPHRGSARDTRIWPNCHSARPGRLSVPLTVYPEVIPHETRALATLSTIDDGLRQP
jgi:hypothetical protein